MFPIFWNIPWNIPYSKIFNISLVYIFFWNIPGIFHIPNNSTFFLFQDFLEYSIFQKIQDFLCCKFFSEYEIIYIPHKKLNFAWKICFLNIPVIFHIPKISIFPLLKVFFGIFLEYSIFQIFLYFDCVPFFLQYSMWYSIFQNCSYFPVTSFSWNISYSYSQIKT